MEDDIKTSLSSDNYYPNHYTSEEINKFKEDLDKNKFVFPHLDFYIEKVKPTLLPVPENIQPYPQIDFKIFHQDPYNETSLDDKNSNPYFYFTQLPTATVTFLINQCSSVSKLYKDTIDYLAVTCIGLKSRDTNAMCDSRLEDIINSLAEIRTSIDSKLEKSLSNPSVVIVYSELLDHINKINIYYRYLTLKYKPRNLDWDTIQASIEVFQQIQSLIQDNPDRQATRSTAMSFKDMLSSMIDAINNQRKNE